MFHRGGLYNILVPSEIYATTTRQRNPRRSRSPISSLGWTRRKRLSSEGWSNLNRQAPDRVAQANSWANTTSSSCGGYCCSRLCSWHLRCTMREPIQIGSEDREALAMEVWRQEQGLSPDQQGLGVGIWRVQQLNIERERDGPDIG